MRPVSIVGIGRSEVGELWNRSIRSIAFDAISGAMAEAGIETADALFLATCSAAACWTRSTWPR